MMLASCIVHLIDVTLDHCYTEFCSSETLLVSFVDLDGTVKLPDQLDLPIKSKCLNQHKIPNQTHIHAYTYLIPSNSMQLPRRMHLPRHRARRDINSLANATLRRDPEADVGRLDDDEGDARVVLVAFVDAVVEVAEVGCDSTVYIRHQYVTQRISQITR